MNSRQTSLRLKERLAYKISMLELEGKYSQAAFLKETGKRLVNDKFTTNKRKPTRNYYDQDNFWKN